MKKIPKWKVIYMLCCLIYVGWVINVGGNEFDRINSQYRRIVTQLDDDRIRSTALVELTAGCRGLSRQQTGLQEEECSSWPLAVVEAKEKEVKERLLGAKDRGIIKVIFFYTGFVLIFLLAPTVLVYLLITAIILVYRNIKIVR
jgi:hypothetical protein